MTMTNRTFGIEIEAKGMTRQRAAEVISAAGIACNVQSYGHSTPRDWKVVPDASVDGGFEVVSPILSGEEGIALVLKVAAALVTGGAKVDKQCGLHVHVGATDLSAADIMNCVKRYAAHESVIDTFMPVSRRENNNRFCKPESRLIACLERQQSYYGNSPMTTGRALCELIGQDERYYKLNIASFLRHGTLEFRQHSGTVSGMKMANWIRFCVNFVENSRIPEVVEVAAPVRTVDPSAPQRANAIEKKFAKMAEIFDLHRGQYNYVSTASLAADLEITENSVVSYISQFRARYNAQIKAKSGRGYYSFDTRSKKPWAYWPTVPCKECRKRSTVTPIAPYKCDLQEYVGFSYPKPSQGSQGFLL